MNKTDKKIEDKIRIILANMFNDVDTQCLASTEEANAIVSIYTKQINTEVQKAVEEAVRGFGEWIFQCPLHPDAEDDWVSDYLQTLKDKQ